jgi:predicted nucleic acid-binding protein
MTVPTSGYLLDTNVVSELRRNKPHGAIIAWLKTIPAPRLFVCAFSVAELQAGVEKLRDRDAAKADEIEAWVDAVCQTWSVLPLDAGCCRHWAREMKGRSDALFEDAFLVATARVHRLIIVTRNTKDFALFDVPTLNPFLYRGDA